MNSGSFYYIKLAFYAKTVKSMQGLGTTKDTIKNKPTDSNKLNA